MNSQYRRRYVRAYPDDELQTTECFLKTNFVEIADEVKYHRRMT